MSDITSKELQEIVSLREQERLHEMSWEDIEGLDHPLSKHSPDVKINAVTTFILTGSLLKAATFSGVPYALVRSWSSKSDWWKQSIDKIRKQKNDELDARITITIDKTMNEISDRLENGDVVLRPTGELVRKPLSGKELTTMLGILYDKRALMRGDPTSRSVASNPSNILNDLKKSFEDLAAGIQKKEQEKLINGAEYEEEDG
jgi:hypothetical protein